MRHIFMMEFYSIMTLNVSVERIKMCTFDLDL